MGNSGSAADRALYACSDNNVKELQKILDALPVASAQRKLVLEARDKEGRSCLTIAAIKNHPKIAKALLQAGADVHYMNKTHAKSFTALHEAAARGLEQVVTVLLQYGANPFLANSLGQTAMELAVLSSSAKIVRIFERQALFTGSVEFEWSRLLGMTLDWNPRYVVVMDHLPFPKPGAPAEPARRQMWIHQDKESIMPKCRVWLDGSSIIRCNSGNECILRLAPSHIQPVGNIYSRFSQGYCLFMRPGKPTRQGSSGRATSWDRLLQLCNASPDSPTIATLAPLLKGASGSTAPVGVLPAAAPTVPLTPRSSQGALPPQAQGQAYPELVDSVLQMQRPHAREGPHTANSADAFLWGAAMAPAPAAAYPPPHILPAGGPQPQAYAQPGMAYPSSTTPSRHPTSMPASPGMTTAAAYRPGGHQRPPAMGMSAVDSFSALPGESDAEFAARLSFLASQPSSGSSTLPLQQRPVDMSALSMASTALASGAPGRAHQSAGGVGTVPWPPRPVPPAASGHSEDLQPSAPPLMPSSPSPGPSAPSPSAASPAPAPEAEDCIICMSGPREAGFLHGGTVHRCVCTPCSKVFMEEMKSGRKEMACPLCRQTVQQVIAVF